MKRVVSNEYLQKPESANNFMQVLYGCCRYEPLVKTFVKHFLESNMGEIDFENSTKYRVFAYLLFVRLEELTFKLFK